MIMMLLGTGLACLIAATIGGGFRGFGLEIPLLQSLRRQTALGTIGIALIGAAAVGTFFPHGFAFAGTGSGNTTDDDPRPRPSYVATTTTNDAATSDRAKSEGERKEMERSWSDLTAQYQRRADLVPNLIVTITSVTVNAHEDEIGNVVHARVVASAVSADTSTPTDAAAFTRYMRAQDALGTALHDLLSATDNTPELQSNANFAALRSQFEGTENRIAVARHDYAKAAEHYQSTHPTHPPVQLP